MGRFLADLGRSFELMRNGNARGTGLEPDLVDALQQA